MPSKPPSITKSKSVRTTFGTSMFLILWAIIDNTSNAEFILQKIGVNEKVSKFLSSDSGILVLLLASIGAFLICIMYQLHRYDAILEQAESNPFLTPEYDLTPNAKQPLKPEVLKATEPKPEPKKTQETKSSKSKNQKPVDSKRIFANVSPEYVVNLFEEHTDTQAEKLLENYIGKWIRIEGNVLNVSDGEYLPQVLVITNIPGHFSNIALTFTDETQMQLAKMLRKTEKISVVGRLDKANQITISLKDCEFVDRF